VDRTDERGGGRVVEYEGDRSSSRTREGTRRGVLRFPVILVGLVKGYRRVCPKHRRHDGDGFYLSLLLPLVPWRLQDEDMVAHCASS